MKQLIIKRNIVLLFALVIMLTLTSSCSKKISFLSSSVVPAASGSVKIKKDKNSNYVINIQLLNLAGSNKLEPARNTYIVWMETQDNITKNIGQIKSTSSLLSKALKASFETVSSSKPSKIFITAEDDANIQYPGTQLVLTTNNL